MVECSQDRNNIILKLQEKLKPSRKIVFSIEQIEKFFFREPIKNFEFQLISQTKPERLLEVKKKKYES